MNNNQAKWIAIPFIIIIIALFFMNTISNDKEVSASENRTLQKIPTVEDIKNGTFTSKFESYFSDQFVFREELNKISSQAKLIMGMKKVKGYYLLDNNWIMPTPMKEMSHIEAKELAKEINKLAEIGMETNKEIYYVSTPHKESMLAHLYPKYTGGLENSLNNKQKFKSYLDTEKVKYIDIDEHFLKEFTEDERENLYFKTDHHWNGIGAFEGFKYIIEKVNIVKNAHWDSYTTTMFDKGYFLGSYNMNLDKIVKEDEIIPYVHKKGKTRYQYFKFDGMNEVKGKEEDFIATRRNEDEILYGGAYMFGNACSILKIRNEESLSNKKIIIFRDSYQAPTTWLFADIFAEVQLVDPRYIEILDMSVEDIIRESDADIVMFMYNNVDFKMMIDTMKEHK